MWIVRMHYFIACLFFLFGLLGGLVLTSAPVMAEFRSLDGSGNSQTAPTTGQAEVDTFLASHGVNASFGSVKLADTTLPSPRLVSNVVGGAQSFAVSSQEVSMIALTFGQVMTHDMIHMELDLTRPAPFAVPRCDPVFDPTCVGGQRVLFLRSKIKSGNGPDAELPLNRATAWLDASFLYGTSSRRSRWLRTFSGGLLNHTLVQGGSAGNVADMLFLTSAGVPQADLNPGGVVETQRTKFPGTDPGAYDWVSGDIRMNASPMVLSIEALFLREHNRRAAWLQKQYPNWSDQRLFQEARAFVSAIMQKIIYDEYLPLVIGQQLPRYRGYNASANPRISMLFSAAAFRYGHSAVASAYNRAKEDRRPDPRGAVPIWSSAFSESSSSGIAKWNIDNLLIGSSLQPEMRIDTSFDPSFRSALGASGSMKFDLLAFNIQRGRELGLPSYVDARAAFGLSRVASFAWSGFQDGAGSLLANAYNNCMSCVDVYVGGLAERPTTTAAGVGPLFAAIIAEQMIRTRDGDRFWFRNPGVFSESVLAAIEATTFSALVLRNTHIQRFPSNGLGLHYPDLTRLDAGLDSSNRSTTSNGGGSSNSVGISQSGYRFQVQLLPGFQLHWTVKETQIDIMLEDTNGMLTPGLGFLGFGFGTSMTDVDMNTAYRRADGTFVVEDGWSQSFNPKRDTDWGGTYDVIPGSVSGEVLPGSTRIKYSRKLGPAVDPYDISLEFKTGQRFDCIFARCPSVYPCYHGISNRGMAGIDFLSGAATVSTGDTVKSVRVTHGYTMFILWLVVYPCGIFIARYLKSYNWWVWIHETTQQIGSTGAISVALLAFVSSPGRHFLTTHSIIGFVLIMALALQLAVGLYSKWRLKHGGIRQRWLAKIPAFHAVLGSGMVILAPYQIHLGINLLFPGEKSWQIAFWTLISFVSATYVTAEVYVTVREIHARKLHASIRSASSSADTGTDGAEDVPNYLIPHEIVMGLPAMTWASVTERVKNGAHYIVISHVVYNISTWLDVHPGGRQILLHAVGTDATLIFLGHSNSSGTRNHLHSFLAIRKLAAMAVGRLSLDDEAENLLSNAEQAKSSAKGSQMNENGFSHHHKLHEDTWDNVRFHNYRLIDVLHITTQVENPVRRFRFDISDIGSTFQWAHIAHAEFARTEKMPVRRLPRATPSLLNNLGGRGELSAAPNTLDESSSKWNRASEDAAAVAAAAAAAPAGQDHHTILPGQHIVIHALIDGEVVERKYTPVPTKDTSRLDIIVKLYNRGRMSQYFSRLSVGDYVKIRGPDGRSLLNPGRKDGSFPYLALIAAGSGLTPCLQLIHHHLHLNKVKLQLGRPRCELSRISLLYCNRTHDDIILKRQLLKWSQETDGAFSVMFCLSRESEEVKNTFAAEQLSIPKKNGQVVKLQQYHFKRVDLKAIEEFLQFLPIFGAEHLHFNEDQWDSIGSPEDHGDGAGDQKYNKSDRRTEEEPDEWYLPTSGSPLQSQNAPSLAVQELNQQGSPAAAPNDPVRVQAPRTASVPHEFSIPNVLSSEDDERETAVDFGRILAAPPRPPNMGEPWTAGDSTGGTAPAAAAAATDNGANDYEMLNVRSIGNGRELTWGKIVSCGPIPFLRTVIDCIQTLNIDVEQNVHVLS